MDQPALQRLGLTAEEKTFMQDRAAKIHTMTGQQSQWIKRHGAAAVGLATLDGAAIMTPPPGMEAGYVPVAVYEGMTEPAGCGATPSPSPTPAPTPGPTPGPTPPGPSPPSASYMIADQSFVCPSGYAAIYDATTCKAASDAVIKKTWWQLKQENSADDPPGCWVYGSKGEYQYLYLNAGRSTAGTRTQRSVLCVKS